jgi:hypothetical protein
MKKNVMVVFLALLVAICIPGIAQSSDGVVLWQIGTPNGAVNPINGSMEYPATGAWTETFDYYVGTDSNPINSPSMPGYIGPDNVCAFAGGRPCTDTTAELNIYFTLNCYYDEDELTLVYNRYGSEADNLLLDSEDIGSVSATEGGFSHFEIPLKALAAGDHTITIQYAGGGSGNGHYIDYLELTAPSLCVVQVDVKPGSCPNPVNTKSKGVLPAAILGNSGFDVSQIDMATVRLEGISPLRWSYEDVGAPVEPFLDKVDCYEDCDEVYPDGYTDLTLKFDTQEVVATLDGGSDGDCLVLELTGELMDGTPIKGEDVVLILDKTNPKPDQEKNNKK